MRFRPSARVWWYGVGMLFIEALCCRGMGIDDEGARIAGAACDQMQMSKCYNKRDLM